jgi:Xaa-Pro aminopeptidase
MEEHMGTQPKTRSVPMFEYQARRERVLKALRGEVAVVLAGQGGPPLLGRWMPNSHFHYLTGVQDESGAAVLFDPKSDDPRRRCVLFLRPVDPEVDRWDGYREMIGAKLKATTGFETIMRNGSLNDALTGAARRSGKLACLHGFASPPAPVSPDLALYRSVCERVPGVGIADRTSLLPSLRAVKSSCELALMQKAIDATAAGYRAAMATMRPGATERQVARAIDEAYHRSGACGHAFNPIVGAGLNSTVLHYTKNEAKLQDGDLLLIDSGARFAGYAADVTRTFPVNGRFTREQRKVYDVVLAAQAAAIRAARAGTQMWMVDAAAREVIEKAGFGDAFCHGVGHPLGLDVHEAPPDGKLRNGMVITVEPGIYLPEKKLGVRIEDDVLITTRGPQVLTRAIPRTVAAIEKSMRRREL